MKLNDTFQAITTLITPIYGNQRGQATGFLYQRLAETPTAVTKTGLQWVEITGKWLITNRHVLFNEINDKEVFADGLIFYERRVDDEGLHWEPILVSRNELLKRAKFHSDPTVDVCVIDVKDLIINKLAANNAGQNSQFLNSTGLTKDMLPGKNNMYLDVADDIIVIGYPAGYFDQTNLYPIVKAGIIASKWGAHFNGEPYFLIDAKLFPGASGSLVISKPKDIVVVDGKIFSAKEKQFAFLGIYSGEPDYPGDESLNIGIVWYGYLIDAIIDSGVFYQDKDSSVEE